MFAMRGQLRISGKLPETSLVLHSWKKARRRSAALPPANDLQAATVTRRGATVLDLSSPFATKPQPSINTKPPMARDVTLPWGCEVRARGNGCSAYGK